MTDAPRTLRELAETWEKRMEDMHDLPMRREMGKWLHELNAALAAATPASTRELVIEECAKECDEIAAHSWHAERKHGASMCARKLRSAAAQRDRQGQ